MRLSIAASVLACTTVQAFSDSSPFVLFSTSQFSQTSNNQLQVTSQVLSAAHGFLNSCPTSRYVLVSQPNVHASDLRDASGCLAKNLCRSNEGAKVNGRLSVAEVLGDLSMDDISDYIKAACHEKGRGARVEEHKLSALPVEKGMARARMLADNDSELGDILEKVEAGNDYTVIYFSSPHESQLYQSDFIEPVQMELKKRSQDVYIGRRQEGERKPPLFVKYQFFTPGIFMALISIFIMLSLLYVGLSAISSLEIPYGAFDKEMGPAAQKNKNL